MKKFIFILSLILLCLFVFSCVKEEIDEVLKTESEQLGLRSGTYYPFQYPVTQVSFDDFKGIYIIENQYRLDSTIYERAGNLNTDQSYRYGIKWIPTKVTHVYKDGTSKTGIFNCPTSYGIKKVIKPDLKYNQLDTLNKENWIRLEKTSRSDKTYSIECGNVLRRYVWKVTTSSGLNQAWLINPRNCGGYWTLTNYQLLFI